LEERCLLSGLSITEYPVGGSVTPDPSAIVSGPDGNLWFTELGNNRIGVLNPTTQVANFFAIPPVGTYAVRPTGITAGPDGNLWFNSFSAGIVGVINPVTKNISEIHVGSAGSVYSMGITEGPDSNIWIPGIPASPYKIGMINPVTNALSTYPIPGTSSAYAWMTSGPDGNLWFTQSNTNLIGMINPTSHTFHMFTIPTANSYPEGITAGPDGNLWFTEKSANQLGTINPTTGSITEFPVPSASSTPADITAGRDGNLWFTEQSAGKIASINPTTHAISEFSVPYANSSPSALTVGPDGNLWFGDGGSLGVATVATSQLVVTQQPPSSVTAGSSFGLTVQAQDSSGNLLSSFNGTVTVALASNPGGATLGGTVTATAVNGVATFSGLTLTKAASGYTLVVSGGGLAESMTNALNVTPAAATQLVITQQPPVSVSVNAAFTFVAAIEDAYGNIVTSANNAVTVGLGNNPGGATLGGTTTVTAVNGVVTFSNLYLTKKGKGYTLLLSSAGLTGTSSSPFNVT
jgi:streptogramin lyase